MLLGVEDAHDAVCDLLRLCPMHLDGWGPRQEKKRGRETVGVGGGGGIDISALPCLGNKAQCRVTNYEYRGVMV